MTFSFTKSPTYLHILIFYNKNTKINRIMPSDLALKRRGELKNTLPAVMSLLSDLGQGENAVNSC